MKPFLGIDLTEDKKNTQANGSIFLISKPSYATAQAFKASSEKMKGIMKQAALPLPVQIGQYACLIIAFITVVGILKGLFSAPGITLADAYQNAPWVFWLAGASLLLSLILYKVSAKKRQAVFLQDDSLRVFSDFAKTCDAVYRELLVPEDAKDVDILSFFYKTKDSKIKVIEKTLQKAPFDNSNYEVFSDSMNLYIANCDGKYAFPLSSIQAIRTVKKQIRLCNWNKDVAFNKGIYAKYKLISDKYNCICCKSYHILEVNQNGNLWGIYFPCYELPVFEAITGAIAQ